MPAHLLPSTVHAHLMAAGGAAHGAQLHISDFQAIVLGLLQGVTELFPVSSLGHTVIYPSLFGWHQVVVAQSNPSSQWLGFVVMLHVGSALGLLIYFWRDWATLVTAWFGSVRRRRVETPTEKLAWLVVLSTIPAGLLAAIFQRELQVLLAKPLYASVFLMVNGLVLLGGEGARRRAVARGGRGSVPLATAAAHPPGDGPEEASMEQMAVLTYKDAVAIGAAQSTALIAGISRDGVCMTAGLLRGLSNEVAARFAFLLATPVILAAGLYKLPDFLSPSAASIRVPALLGMLFAAVAAMASVHWLVRWFRSRNLTPFAAYCLAFGLAMTVYFSVS